jgi:hypothetical protein
MQRAERVWSSMVALGLAITSGCSGSSSLGTGATSGNSLGAGGAGAANAFAQIASRPAPSFSAPLTPPPGTIYFGAYVATEDPETPSQQIADTAAFEQSIGRKLAIDMHYHLFTDTLVGAGEQDDVTNGRIPLVSWSCVEANQTGVTDADIAAGYEDKIIIDRAVAVATFKYPLFIRYKWEMNLLYNKNCGDSDDVKDKYGDLHYSPTDYIAAWEHIRNVFAANGATNVIWLWNPSGDGDPPDPYYPGDSQVDWVGFDWYDTFNPTLYFKPTYTFRYNKNTQRQAWTYPYFSSHHQSKPLMIGETGVEPKGQAAYIEGNPPYAPAEQALRKAFPQIQAYMYWNSSGAAGNFRLVSPGLSYFATFANDHYLSAVQPSPSPSLSPSPGPSPTLSPSPGPSPTLSPSPGPSP